MKREPFASAAGAKWRRHRALGLLAAGLAPEVETGTRGAREFAQAITARLAHGDTELTWRVDDLAARGSMVGTLDRQQFEKLLHGVPDWRRSLALRSSSAVDAVDAWNFFETEEEAKGLREAGWWFWVSARVRELKLPTRPPFVVGHFAGTTAEEAAAQLAEDEDLHPAFSVSALTRTAPHCDIQIMCDRDVERAVDHASRASAAIGGSSCRLCVVTLKNGLPEYPRMRMFLPLRDALGAGGLIVGKGDANAALELTRTLIHEFAEGNPLWQQRFATEAGPAMLLCDERMATHRLTSWTPAASAEERPAGQPGWTPTTPSPDAPALSEAEMTRSWRPAADTKQPPAEEVPPQDESAPGPAPVPARRFPFMSGGSSSRRVAPAASDPKRSLWSRGPKRSQRGTAPLEARKGGDLDGTFGKKKGMPDAPSATIPGLGRIAVPDQIADRPPLERGRAVEDSGKAKDGQKPAVPPKVPGYEAARSGKAVRGSAAGTPLPHILGSVALPKAPHAGREHRAASSSAPPPGPAVGRYLQVAVSASDDPDRPVEGALEISKDYSISVFVDVPRDDPLSGVSDSAEPPLDGGSPVELTVLFWERTLSPTPVIQHIQLPHTGRSTTCRIPVTTPVAQGRLLAQVSLLHRDRVLQTGTLDLPVGIQSGSPAFHLDAAPRQVLSGLEQRTRFDAALLMGETGDERTLTVISRNGATVFGLDHSLFDSFSAVFGAVQGAMDHDPSQFESLRAPGTTAMLRALAQTGGALRRALTEPSGGLPSTAAYIQLVTAKPGGVFPLEYLYQLEPPVDDAPICERAEEGLSAERSRLVDGWCPGCAPADQTAASQRHMVCPLAFWGARCVLERRTAEPALRDHRDALAPEPRHLSEGILRPLRCVVVGTTDRIGATDAEAVVDELRSAAGTLLEAEDWSDWEYVVERTLPTMLALIAYRKRDARSKIPQLEIGAASTLDLSALQLTHVRSGTDAPPPLALVFGHEAALADLSFERFASSLQSLGAVVVSTIAAVRGADMAAMTAELVGAIGRAQHPMALGELMPEVRRRLLASGPPTVLSLVALADADWRVEAGA